MLQSVISVCCPFPPSAHVCPARPQVPYARSPPGYTPTHVDSSPFFIRAASPAEHGPTGCAKGRNGGHLSWRITSPKPPAGRGDGEAPSAVAVFLSFLSAGGSASGRSLDAAPAPAPATVLPIALLLLLPAPR